MMCGFMNIDTCCGVEYYLELAFSLYHIGCGCAPQNFYITKGENFNQIYRNLFMEVFWIHMMGLWIAGSLLLL